MGTWEGEEREEGKAEGGSDYLGHTCRATVAWPHELRSMSWRIKGENPVRIQKPTNPQFLGIFLAIFPHTAAHPLSTPRFPASQSYHIPSTVPVSNGLPRGGYWYFPLNQPLLQANLSMHPTQGFKYPWGNALTKFAFQTTSTLCSKFANQSKRNSSEHESGAGTYPRGIQRQPQAAALSAQDTTRRRLFCMSCSLQLHYRGFTVGDWPEHFSQLSPVHLRLPIYKYRYFISFTFP